MVHSDGSLLVGEMGAQRIYKVDSNNNIDEFAVMDELDAWRHSCSERSDLHRASAHDEPIMIRSTRARDSRLFRRCLADVVEIGEYAAFTIACVSLPAELPAPKTPVGFAFNLR